ncbi:hypothetical protein PCASD_12305 [Puccinia coronata f. sp. avenae]|uniref:Uncharacterized protein n=1 Tax=Puccinia coronata f. sp. avenae TaxID=200324 RepID=A0A2N5TCY7_9BASI|nr:hypothetical protein PCASD_12305 [Puccinia coronata f. sp. avenae]
MSLRTRVTMYWQHPHPCPHPQRPFQTGTRLVQCQLVGSSAIPTSWYSSSSPGGSPDELVLHQLARRAPSKLVLHMLARRAPSKLALHRLARRAPGKLVLHRIARRAPGKLVLHRIARRAPGKLVLHRLARRAPGKLVLHRLARRALGQLLQCQLAGSSAIPTSWYSARSPGCCPDELVLHQLARRAPDELVLHQLARRAPEELVLHQLARRAPGELILHQLPRRALGELALYQLSGSWQAGIFLPACQEATSVSTCGHQILQAICLTDVAYAINGNYVPATSTSQGLPAPLFLTLAAARCLAFGRYSRSHKGCPAYSDLPAQKKAGFFKKLSKFCRFYLQN